LNAKRITTALIIALVVSGIFTFLLSRKLAGATRVAPKKQLFVAASKPLDAGQALAATDLTLVEWPENLPLKGGFSKIQDAVGRTVLYPLAQDEPIVDRQLAAPGAGVGLTANIPAGMRAISVRSDEVVGVAGFLLPGTRVDVLLSYTIQNTSTPHTVTVLQDVQVLAAGQQIHPDPEGKPSSVNVVTLLLKPEDAEKVVQATSMGTIHFVLRNATDKEQAVDPPISAEQIAGVSLQTAKPAVTVKHAAPSSKYEVQTILAGKGNYVQSF
jgi:pilus assembly protein CpaB